MGHSAPKQIANWNSARDVWEVQTTGLFCEHSDVFSETWPSSGMTRGGTAYEQPTSAPRMVGSASSSLLPTPEAKLSDSGPDYARATRPGSGGDDLTTTLHRLLPTPTVQDASNTAGPSQLDRNSLPLNTIVTLLPTPACNDMGEGKTVAGWDE